MLRILDRLIDRLIDRRIAQYQNDLVTKHCDEVQNIYNEMRGWRHDYHSHIQAMKAYLALGQHDRLSEYLDRLDNDLVSVDTVIRTGNVMVDAIINSKLSLAKAKGIFVNSKAAVPSELTITDVDLCVIIGNLLDNAIEACMAINASGRRFIRVYIGMKKSQLYLSVTNSAQGKALVNGSHFTTTKKGFHGYGLVRVDRVCEKYAGYATRASEEDGFTSEVLLPLKR